TRDRILATQAAAILLTQLAAWLGIAFLGFTLVLWPFASSGIAAAFADAGSSLFTLGFSEPPGTVPAALVFIAAATGLVVVTREPSEAWPDFVGWRVNYEHAAYAIAAAVDAVPARWSGPRSHPTPPISPLRPPLGRPRRTS